MHIQPEIHLPTPSPGRTVNVLLYGAKGDETTNDYAAFMRAIETGNNIYVPGGRTYLINSPGTNGLALQEGQMIYGDGQSSRLKTTHNGVLLWLNNFNIVTRLQFIGSGKADTGKPLQSLIMSYQHKDSLIQGCTLSQCAGDGTDPYYGGAITVSDTQNAPPYYRGVKVTGCNIYNSGVGLYWSKRGEYNTCSDTMISANNVGMINTGGNNNAVTVNLTGNGLGLWLYEDVNSGHGSYTACSFNHNETDRPLLIEDIADGEMFTNCSFYYGNNASEINNSEGIRFYNCDFQNGEMELNGNSNLLMVGCRLNPADYTITVNSGSDFTYVNNLNF